MMDLALQPLRKYADFNGRARRKEYWLFVVALAVAFCLLFMARAIVEAVAGPVAAGGVAILIGIAFLGVLIPSLAVRVRRLHDINLSGFWILIGLVPILGPVALVVLSLIAGTSGGNRFGSDPKLLGGAAGEAALIF